MALLPPATGKFICPNCGHIHSTTSRCPDRDALAAATQ